MPTTAMAAVTQAAEPTPAEPTPEVPAAEGGGEKKKKRWFPLESNPQVMNSFVGQMGFPTSQLAFCDVFSTEEWALDMVPQPTAAVLFLYPIKDNTEEHRAAEAARIATEGQHVDPAVYYMKQTVGNACGTIGILHALCNIAGRVPLAEGSYLAGFLAATKDMTPDEIAAYLEADDSMEEQHSSAATSEQSATAPPPIDEAVNTHFVCFTHVGGHLYELDGRKTGPINHGASSEETLLADAARVIKGFFDRDPEETRFTMVALAPPQEG